MTRFLASTATLLTIGLALSTTATAHEIWIEPQDNELRAYYGYLDRNLREVTPGRLDRIIHPQTIRIDASGTAHALPASVERDHIALALENALTPGESTIIVYDNGPVYVNDGIGTHWIMSARYAATSTDPIAEHLELDIIPTGKPGEFRIVFEGAPLANSMVRLTNESGWSMQRRSDAEGIAQFHAMPWKGLYMVYVRHTVERDGSRERVLENGEKETIQHDQRGFITTLSFLADQGLEPLPGPPPSQPYESGVRGQ